MINNLKKFISCNLLILIPWIALGLVSWMYSIHKHEQSLHSTGTVLGFIISASFFAVIGLFCLCFILWVIEYITAFRLKTKFILENKIYNIFFTISLFLTVIVLIVFFALILYAFLPSFIH